MANTLHTNEGGCLTTHTEIVILCKETYLVVSVKPKTSIPKANQNPNLKPHHK